MLNVTLKMFVRGVMYTYAATVHVNGHLHRHTCCICRQEGPQEIWELMQDCAVVTVWCGLIHHWFVLLQIGLIVQEGGDEILFHVPRATPHFGHDERDGPHEVRTSCHGMYCGDHVVYAEFLDICRERKREREREGG